MLARNKKEMAKSKKGISKAHAKQLERLEEDQRMEDHTKELNKDMRAFQASKWNDEASELKRLRRCNEGMKMELMLENKTLLKVRQEQIRQLYQADEEQYKMELKRKGLALFKDRL